MRYPTNAWDLHMRQLTRFTGLLAFAICTMLFWPQAAGADTVVYRVNAGGPTVPATDGGPAWSQDLNLPNASPFVNVPPIVDNVFYHSQPLRAPDASVPAYVPPAVLDDERWDGPETPEMDWEFPVPSGTYRVNLLLMDGYSGTQFVGARLINVVCEGQTKLANYDIFAHFGGYSAGMESFVTQVTDGHLSLVFQHVANANDPAIRAIEIVAVNATGDLHATPSDLQFGQRLVNTLSPPKDVTITNTGVPGSPSLHIANITISPGFLHNLSPQTLAPGESRTFQVRFAPSAVGVSSGSMVITHDGGSSPLAIALAGTAVSSFPINFGKSQLSGGGRVHPTSLQFGPDGRLYVAEANGRIFALTIQRGASNLYSVTATEPINLIRDIPNHDDNGQFNPAITDRLVTGILVKGTAASPVIYVTSSDPRMDVARDLGGDTNSGMLSKLILNNGTWSRIDLVRGLPRSKDDHCTNGMALDSLTNTLYVAQAGQCNMGAPSLNFSFLPEYALTGAILSVNLNALGQTPYDLPTLDDENRPGVNDTNDPFGGDFGKNQAIIAPGGPVQVYSPGYRNPYDLLIHSNGHLYTSDNGPNAGWGGPPLANGPGGVCTNDPNDNDSFTYADNLHMIPFKGFYAGHPNPTRASRSNTFNASDPQSPVPVDDPVECEYRVPGTDGSLAQWMYSVNGLVEYRGSNFGGAMLGSILGASFANTIERITLNAAGDSARSVAPIFSNVDVTPLDVTAQADGSLFPGTIWTADYVTGRIWVFEPGDYDGGGFACTGANSPALDEDGDGYSNADEIANNTNPCSAADQPADFDHDLLSDRNDPDDDNDGILDVNDAFARDAANGATPLPVLYSWDGGDPGTGLFGLGFTGLMANGVTDYLTQYSGTNLTAGGAAGKFTIDAVPAGDALGSRNNQQYGFQFGVAEDSTSAPFTVHTRLSKPFFGGAPADSMSQGLVIGTGTQSDYLELAMASIGGAFHMGVTHEIADVPALSFVPAAGIATANELDLYLEVTPASGTVQAYYRIDGGVRLPVGGVITLPAGSALRSAVRTSQPLALGIMATSRGATPFTATWDFIEAVPTGLLGVAPNGANTNTTRLLPSAPHPVRNGTNVRFALATTARTRVALYAVDGRLVRVLADGWRSPGAYSIPWDGRDEQGAKAAPGVYFVRLDSGAAHDRGRMIVLE